MSLISKRYAEAFFQLAKEQNQVEEELQNLTFLTEVWNTQPDLRGYLKNPQKGPEEKATALRNIFSDQIDKTALNLVLLLLRKDRLSLLPEICEDYKELKDSYKNVLNITITTASRAEPELIQKISETFRVKYHADSVKAEEKVDPSIIGGVIVQVGDTRYDDSVTGKLKALQDELVSN